MATISSTGIGSGLDVATIVNQLMALERRPLGLLQQSASELNTQVSAIGKLRSLTSALRDASNSLSSLTLWGQTKATSSNSAAVTVSTAAGAVAGNYAIHVGNLAASQTVYSGSFANAQSTLNEGSLTIELGSWTGEPSPTGFTAKAGTSPLAITIGPEDTSLEAIRDKINAAGAGVTASLINDAGGTRLSLRSTTTGAENGFRVTASETVDDGNPATGLSALAYDATNPSSTLTRSETAVNANATINGIAVSSATNTLAGVSDGLTIQLLQKTTTAVDVSVASDTEAVRGAITSFVSAFNAVASYLRDQTKYDAASKTGGTLQGDRLATGLQSQLRGLINQGSTASATFERLSDIGISFSTDGTLVTSSSKLDNALKNLPELKKVLSTDGVDAASSGFIDRFKDFTALVLGSEGSFESRDKSLQSMLSSNSKRQASMNTRLTLVEARLYKQYQTLDTNLAQLNSVSSYLTQQLAMLNNNSKS